MEGVGDAEAVADEVGAVAVEELEVAFGEVAAGGADRGGGVGLVVGDKLDAGVRGDVLVPVLTGVDEAGGVGDEGEGADLAVAGEGAGEVGVDDELRGGVCDADDAMVTIVGFDERVGMRPEARGEHGGGRAGGEDGGIDDERRGAVGGRVRRGGDVGRIAELAQDGGAEVEVGRLVLEAGGLLVGLEVGGGEAETGAGEGKPSGASGRFDECAEGGDLDHAGVVGPRVEDADGVEEADADAEDVGHCVEAGAAFFDLVGVLAVVHGLDLRGDEGAEGCGASLCGFDQFFDLQDGVFERGGSAAVAPFGLGLFEELAEGAEAGEFDQDFEAGEFRAAGGEGALADVAVEAEELGEGAEAAGVGGPVPEHAAQIGGDAAANGFAAVAERFVRGSVGGARDGPSGVVRSGGCHARRNGSRGGEVRNCVEIP